MQRMLNIIVLGIGILTLLACEKPETDVPSESPKSTLTERKAVTISEFMGDSNTQKTPVSTPLSASEFRTIQWADLMPKEDLEALLNPPGYVTDIEDGSFEDQISNQIRNTITGANDDRYYQALTSSRIVREMDGQAIRIPGFIVPLEFDDGQTITQFFLVPFFGACVHVPPPPPNQIIFVHYPQGLELDALYDPFWISGILKTSFVENDMASAAYSMQMQSFEVYKE